MAIMNFKTINGINGDLAQIQDNVRDIHQVLIQNPLMDGIMIKDQTITSGTPLQIKHRLDRKIIGWVVTEKNADARVWRTNPTVLADQILELNSSANVTINLFVF
mgnify:CR=1 FL=1